VLELVYRAVAWKRVDQIRYKIINDINNDIIATPDAVADDYTFCNFYFEEY
jgi:hypothetical protein